MACILGICLMFACDFKHDASLCAALDSLQHLWKADGKIVWSLDPASIKGYSTHIHIYIYHTIFILIVGSASSVEM